MSPRWGTQPPKQGGEVGPTPGARGRWKLEPTSGQDPKSKPWASKTCPKPASTGSEGSMVWGGPPLPPPPTSPPPEIGSGPEVAQVQKEAPGIPTLGPEAEEAYLSPRLGVRGPKVLGFLSSAGAQTFVHRAQGYSWRLRVERLLDCSSGATLSVGPIATLIFLCPHFWPTWPPYGPQTLGAQVPALLPGTGTDIKHLMT